MDDLARKYSEAYERALLLDEEFRQAGSRQTEAMHELNETERAFRSSADTTLASIRLAVKEKHPEIDPTRCIGLRAEG